MVNKPKAKKNTPKVIKRYCVRCHNLMGDEQTPWCGDCNTVLEGMILLLDPNNPDDKKSKLLS